MLENLNKKQKTILISILILMVFVILFYLYKTLGSLSDNDLFEDNTSFISDEENFISDSTFKDQSEEDSSTILIHVSGQVENETVVTLPEGSRIQDAIKAAGGLKKDADLTSINLAYILEDGEKIYIPKKGEELSETITTYETTSLDLPSSSPSKFNKININKASQIDLETIPGVGPSTALKIITYRKENGNFSKIEDIKNVSGIGDAKYEKMKDYISVK